MPRIGRPTKVNVVLLRELLNQGIKRKDIAKSMGVTPDVVSKAARKIGLLSVKLPRGASHGRWKDGHYEMSGYRKVMLPDHPRADARGYVLEHIVVWEKFHDKTLPDGWCIHHINGIKNDNDPHNLIGYPQAKHRNLIPYLMQRINALEMEVKRLRGD